MQRSHVMCDGRVLGPPCSYLGLDGHALCSECVNNLMQCIDPFGKWRHGLSMAFNLGVQIINRPRK